MFHDHRFIVGLCAAAVTACATLAPADADMIKAFKDTWVRIDYGTAGSPGGTDSEIRTRFGDSNDRDYHTYMGFSTSTITASVKTASLDMYAGHPSENDNRTFYLFGLTDESAGPDGSAGDGDGWDEAAINWDNAPGNATTNNGGSRGFVASDTVEIGSVSLGDVNSGDKVTFSGVELANLLNADTDGTVTLMLVVDGNSGGSNRWRSLDYGSTQEFAPTINYTIPEPASLALFVTGLGLVVARRRK